MAILRNHIATFDVADDGRLFRTANGKPFSGSTISKVWKEARGYAFPPEVEGQREIAEGRILEALAV